MYKLANIERLHNNNITIRTEQNRIYVYFDKSIHSSWPWQNKSAWKRQNNNI